MLSRAKPFFESNNRMVKIKEKNYWQQQKNLEYKSRLQKESNGCPWPANIIAIVKAARSESIKSIKILDEAKRLYRIMDDDIMLLLSAWELKDWKLAETTCNKIKQSLIKPQC